MKFIKKQTIFSSLFLLSFSVFVGILETVNNNERKDINNQELIANKKEITSQEETKKFYVLGETESFNFEDSKFDDYKIDLYGKNPDDVIGQILFAINDASLVNKGNEIDLELFYAYDFVSSIAGSTATLNLKMAGNETYIGTMDQSDKEAYKEKSKHVIDLTFNTTYLIGDDNPNGRLDIMSGDLQVKTQSATPIKGQLKTRNYVDFDDLFAPIISKLEVSNDKGTSADISWNVIKPRFQIEEGIKNISLSGRDLSKDLGLDFSGTTTIKNLNPDVNYKDWTLNIKYRDIHEKVGIFSQTIPEWREPLKNNSYNEGSFKFIKKSFTDNSANFSFEVYSGGSYKNYDPSNTILQYKEAGAYKRLNISLLNNQNSSNKSDKTTFTYHLSDLDSEKEYTGFQLSIDKGRSYIDLTGISLKLNIKNSTISPWWWLLLLLIILLIILFLILFFVKRNKEESNIEKYENSLEDDFNNSNFETYPNNLYYEDGGESQIDYYQEREDVYYDDYEDNTYYDGVDEDGIDYYQEQENYYE